MFRMPEGARRLTERERQLTHRNPDGTYSNTEGKIVIDQNSGILYIIPNSSNTQPYVPSPQHGPPVFSTPHPNVPIQQPTFKHAPNTFAGIAERKHNDVTSPKIVGYNNQSNPVVIQPTSNLSVQNFMPETVGEVKDRTKLPEERDVSIFKTKIANFLNNKGISTNMALQVVENPIHLANYLQLVGIPSKLALQTAETNDINLLEDFINPQRQGQSQNQQPSLTLPASQPVSQPPPLPQSPPPASQPSQPQPPPWLTSHQAFIDELNRRVAEHDREYEDTIRELQQQQARNPIEKQALQHIQYLHDPTYRHAFESILGPFTNMQNQLQQIGLGQQMTTFPRPRKRDRVGEVMSHLDENMYVTGFDEEPPYFKKRRYLE